jgi:Splicing factor 3B subunit 1
MADVPMTPIIMNAPGFMQEDQHNRYLTDEELDAVLPSSGYSIVTPPPGYAPMVALLRKLMATPVTEVGGFQIQDQMQQRLLRGLRRTCQPRFQVLETLPSSKPRMRNISPRF